MRKAFIAALRKDEGDDKVMLDNARDYYDVKFQYEDFKIALDDQRRNKNGHGGGHGHGLKYSFAFVPETKKVGKEEKPTQILEVENVTATGKGMFKGDVFSEDGEKQKGVSFEISDKKENFLIGNANASARSLLSPAFAGNGKFELKSITKLSPTESDAAKHGEEEEEEEDKEKEDDSMITFAQGGFGTKKP